MPVVNIQWWKGRTKEQKKEIVKGITEVFVKQGVPKEHLQIIINDIEKDNWGIQGTLASEKY